MMIAAIFSYWTTASASAHCVEELRPLAMKGLDCVNSV